MRGFPARGWYIKFVGRHDAERPNARRPAQVLLSRNNDSDLFIPTSGDFLRIFGNFVSRIMIDTAEDWVACEPHVEWQPGKIPIIRKKLPLEIDFIDPIELDRRRRKEATDDILAALGTELPHESLLKRVARLEHADRLLDGHPVSVAALIRLHIDCDRPSAAEFGTPSRLVERMKDAAPSGPQRLMQELHLPGFDRLRSERRFRDALLTAAQDAFEESLVLRAGQWPSLLSATLWSWWLRWKAGQNRTSLRGLSEILKIPAAAIVQLAEGRPLEESSVIKAKLPSPERALAELGHGYTTMPGHGAVEAVAMAHRPRMLLFASQMAELERVMNRTERLVDWEQKRVLIGGIARWSAELNDLPPWQRARLAAQRVRELVLSRPSDEPISLTDVLQTASARLSVAALPLSRLMGTWAVGPGCAPVIGISPMIASADLGVLRFTVAHQLGHIIEWAAGNVTSCLCARLAEREDSDSGDDDGESFANAFAVYLLAPRDAMIRLVGRPKIVTSQWLERAASDAAVGFGISPGAALRHVLNCLEERTVAEQVSNVLRKWDWADERTRSQDDINKTWSAEREFVNAEIGDLPEEEPMAALRRPRSTMFEQLASEASAKGLLAKDVALELEKAL